MLHACLAADLSLQDLYLVFRLALCVRRSIKTALPAQATWGG